MKQYIIKGGTPLRGEVTIGGAKNAALGIIVAAIMADEPVKIDPWILLSGRGTSWKI